MKKNIDIDITALLDVLLIVLFAVLLNVNATANERVSKLDEANEEIERLENINEMSMEKNQILERENQALQEESTTLANELLEIHNIYDTQNKNLKKIVSALAKWIDMSEEEIYEIIETNDDVMADYSEDNFTETSLLLENLFKYEVISKKFIFIDLTIEGDANKVYLNGNYTNITISSDEWYDESLRFTIINELSTYIDDYINDIDGGYSFILITYEHDDRVYTYVSNVILSAIDAVKIQYQDEKILETEYIVSN